MKSPAPPAAAPDPPRPEPGLAPGPGFAAYAAGFLGFVTDPRRFGSARTDPWARRALHGIGLNLLVGVPIAAALFLVGLLVANDGVVGASGGPALDSSAGAMRLLFMLLLAPAAEELLFRAPLRLSRAWILAAPLGVAALFLLAGSLQVAVGFGALTVGAMLLLWLRGIDDAGLGRFSHRSLPLTVPLSSILYGVFQETGAAWSGADPVAQGIGMALFTLGQTLGGFVLAYARLTGGVSVSIAASAAWTAILLGLPPLLPG